MSPVTKTAEEEIACLVKRSKTYGGSTRESPSSQRNTYQLRKESKTR